MLATGCSHRHVIFVVIMSDDEDEDEVDLNPSSTPGEVTKKRSRTVETPPESGDLKIRVHVTILQKGQDTFTKSRYFREISIKDGQNIVSNFNTETPSTSAGVLHGLVVKYFGSTALGMIDKIASGDGDVTEYSLMGDGYADYKVSETKFRIIWIHIYMAGC